MVGWLVGLRLLVSFGWFFLLPLIWFLMVFDGFCGISRSLEGLEGRSFLLTNPPGRLP